MIDFDKKLSDLLRARFPFIYITTFEEERACQRIMQMAQKEELVKTPRDVYTWSMTSGICLGGKCEDESSKNPLHAMDFVIKCDTPSLFLFNDFHVYFGDNGKPDFQVVRKLRDIFSHLKKCRNPKNILFISPKVVIPSDLEKDITIIEFPLPTRDEILAVLNEMIEVNKKIGKIKINIEPGGEEKLAGAALGLTLQEAENAFARAMVNDGTLDSENDVKVVLEEKRQVIRKSGILEYINTDLTMNDVGGLENLKKWFSKRNNSWQEKAKKYCLPAPKGVLITGIPGCGKSLIAKAISSMWQLPLLRLDIGKIFSGIVGSSEHNMRQAIATAEAVAPSILWVDEIEKGFSSVHGGGDSGTSSRIFGTFLTWMQEKEKPVFVVATANNIHALPSELLRKGRFDEIFFVDLPTFRERMKIFKVHMKKRLINPEVIGDFVLNKDIVKRLSEMTEGFIGSEIEQVVISALFEAFYENRSIKLNDFIKSIENTVSLSITQAEQILAIREWASLRAISATAQDDKEEYSTPPPVKPERESLNNFRGGRTVDI